MSNTTHRESGSSGARSPTSSASASDAYPTSGSTSTTNSSQKSKTPNGMPVGKRMQKKIKKIKEKYGDQDEEDREKAMLLLGNQASQAHHIIQQEERQKHPKGQNIACDSSGEDEPTPSAAGTKQKKEVRFVEAPDTSAVDAVEVEHEGMRRRVTSFEEDEKATVERMERETTGELPCWTGVPPPGTEIDGPDWAAKFAFVVCAPYSALVHYKYKSRLTPGHEKKGTAARAILSSFNTASQQLPGAEWERLVIKRIPDEELLLQMVGNVKLHAQGSSPISSAAGRRPAERPVDEAAAQLERRNSDP